MRLTKSMVLSLPDLACLLRFLQLEQNCLIHLVTVLWSTALLLFVQQIFLVVSASLSLNLNSESISSWIRLCCMFICMAFKSHMVWSNALTTTVLSTTAGTSLNLNCFGRIHCKLVHIKILQNFWLTLVIMCNFVFKCCYLIYNVC